jgi:FKBP-type peptidyl-prolyl cis-trans isomerase FkpA
LKKKMKYTPLIAGSAILLFGCSMFSKNNATGQQEMSDSPPATTEVSSQQPAEEGYTMVADGLEQKKIIAGTGTATAKPGDFAEMNVIFSIGDSVMINSYEMNNKQPVMQMLQAPTMKGDLMEGLLTMKAGDSTIFRMRMDTLAARSGQPVPSYVKPGDYAEWRVRMISIKTKEELEQETAKKDQAQLQTDDKLIQEYFQQKGIKNAKKDPSGFYYVVHKPGTGASPKEGQAVSVNYTGQNLDGEKFDSNTDPAFHHVEPFTFNLGKGSVIKGWDKGVAIMKKGMKATFYFPSPLGYGDRGAGAKIPPNAILIFDIELLDFK